MKTQDLDLEKIRLDGGTQPREQLDLTAVHEYAEGYKALTKNHALPKFPFPVVFFDGTDHWLSSGFHRYFGRKEAGFKSLECEVRKGTREDAILHAVGENENHGVRRTYADKRRAVLIVLANPAWRKWSDRRVAETCKVAHSFVGTLRDELEKKEEAEAQKNGAGAESANGAAKPKTRTGRDGKEHATTREKKKADKGPVKDAFGNEVPKSCLDIFSDRWLQDTYDLFALSLERLREKRLADGMDKRKAHYPFLDAKEIIDAIAVVDNTIDKLVKHIREHRPAAVCPACRGEGCPKCRMKGLVSRDLYSKLGGKES
jgi:hypothetical protein